MRLSTILTSTVAAAAMLGAAPAPLAPTAAQAQSAGPSVVQVNTGRGRLVTLARPMSDLFIADDSVADVQVRSPTQLYIFGKKPGETTVSATAKGGGVVYASTVRVGNNFDSIGSMLALAMPESKIVATPMNGLVLLTGTVAAPQDAAEAERLVQAFVGEGTKVLSRLRSATPLQVNLQVRIAEVSRSFMKNVGVNLSTVDATGGFKLGISQGRAGYNNQFIPGGPLATGFTVGDRYSRVAQAGLGSTLGLAGKLLGLDILGAIDLGETLGQVTTLANPNSTCLSGETCTFLAGGEVPIPIAQALGTVSVEFKQYGVSLAYSPTVLSDGRISMRVRPEVSQLDYSNAVTLNGTRVPGLTSRRTENTVELGSGQSLVIGGLLQNNSNNTVNKTPFLGDVPILGALFRSNGWQRNETELVIVITPYLVRPVDSLQQVALPTDGYRNANDAERILLGKLSGGQSGEKRPVPTMAAPVAVGPAVGAAVPVPVQPRAFVPQPRAAEPSRKSTGPRPGFSN